MRPILLVTTHFNHAEKAWEVNRYDPEGNRVGRIDRYKGAARAKEKAEAYLNHRDKPEHRHFAKGESIGYNFTVRAAVKQAIEDRREKVRQADHDISVALNELRWVTQRLTDLQDDKKVLTLGGSL